VLWATKRHVAPFIFAVLFVYLGLTFASHLLFNAQDAAGWVCREKEVVYQSDARHPNRVSISDYKGLVNLDPGKTHEVPEFKTNELCQSTGSGSSATEGIASHSTARTASETAAPSTDRKAFIPRTLP
jgi:hypothetical protein